MCVGRTARSRAHSAVRCPVIDLAIGLAIGLATGFGGASPEVAAQDAVDGTWTGRAETTIGGGRCGQVFELRATIAGGELTGTATRGPQSFEMHGKVGSDGKLKWNVRGPGTSASGQGRMDAGRAGGAWIDETRRDCEGDFVLDRQG